jgi:hypothetical protein
MLDEYYALLKGHPITENTLIRMMLTDVGSSFYSYMIMLELADRKVEAARMEDWRKRVFRVRDNLNIYHQPKNSTPAEDIVEMEKLYAEMKVLIEMLMQYRRGESPIFHSAENTVCGLIHILKDYYKRNPTETKD